MAPEALAQVLRPLAALFPRAEYDDLIVGLDGADDAAVYRLHADEALVATTDFFPPVVDDPTDFGAIAAANAMGDVFAMGGEVLLALNLLAVPDDLELDVVEAIVRGGAETVRRAGGVVAGGHSVTDDEPKYGLAVIGRVHPDRVLRKAGARAGDVLVLTKPLGTGLVTTALKQGAVEPADLAAASGHMRALNRAAGRAAVAHGATAATDVTGFGLLGHGMELAERSAVGLRLRPYALPLLPGAMAYAAAGAVPGGTGRNRAAFGPRVRGLDGLGPLWSDVLFDPQTSGGLLVALDAADVDAFLAALEADGGQGWVIGEVISGAGITLVPATDRQARRPA